MVFGQLGGGQNRQGAAVLTAAIALALGLAAAGVGSFLKRALRMSGLDAVIVTAVIAEFVKKLTYIFWGSPEKSLSLVLAAPLFLTAGWWLRARHTRRHLARIRVPAAWLVTWLGALAFFTLLNPEGSFLALAGYLGAWLWVPAASGLLGRPGRWTFRVLWLAVAVGVINQLVGGDPLWRAYRAAAEPLSVGARYLPGSGYTGSLFSSPSEFGVFALAATALLLATQPRPRGLLPLSLVAALLTGSRYVMLATAVLWVAFAWSQLSRVRPGQAVAAVLAYSPIQDGLGRRLLEDPPTLPASSAPFIQRLFTVGTLGARVGFVESWSSILSRHWLLGIGLIDFWSPATLYPDDRHNLILWLVLRGGMVALVSYFGFVWLHFRSFGTAKGRVARPAIAYLLAALIMSMGGPQATSGWFFLTTGMLFGMSFSHTEANRRALSTVCYGYGRVAAVN